jgi:hypothetical protein
MLTLHNWGGTKAIGTADPRLLADRFNVVAIALDYLQSGPYDPAAEPYDFGYLQALDALVALHYVYAGLLHEQMAFDRGRIYAVGGSGGGNVALMCNKLAPRTFACVLDLSGMAKLNDDIAYNLPGGSKLNAGYSPDQNSPKHLSPDAQALRFIGRPAHLATMKQLGNTAKIIVVHGRDDALCPLADARELVENLQIAQLAVEPHFIGPEHLDGKPFVDSGHRLGDRGQIVCHLADAYLIPGTAKTLRRAGETDFDLRDRLVSYDTPRGRFVISYESGYPVGSFEPAASGARPPQPSSR